MPTIWQMYSGDASSTYADTLIRHSVGLIYPGDAGPWRPDRDSRKLRHLQQFVTEVQPDDVFVLRRGNSRLQAIGVVAGAYEYLNQFDDVNGWDLQHARRVRWLRLPDEHDFGRPVFVGSRFGRVTHSEVLPLVSKMLGSPPFDWTTAPLPPLPQEEPYLDNIPQGLRDVVGLAQDLGGNLYWDEARFGQLPGEHEIVAHLVVPFLRGLGWRDENLSIEWCRTDIAVFSRLPRTAENCCLIVEAKALDTQLDAALDQVTGYAECTGARCDVLVTNGVRYRLHAADRDYAPVAYANLCRLRKSATELFGRLRRS